MGRDADTIRAFYRAFQEEDYEAEVAALLADDIVWQVAGTNPLAGIFRGVDQVLRAMRQYGEHSQGTLRLDTKAILEGAGHVIAIHEATARKGDFAYRAHEIDIFHVEADRIVAMWSFSEDQEATDTLWT